MLKRNINKILVPILCYTEVQIVLRQADYFHKKYSSTVTIFWIMPPKGMLERIINPNSLSTLTQRHDAFSKLTLNIAKFYKNDIPDFIKFQVKKGGYVTSIQQELKMKKYDLIILKESCRVKSLLSRLQSMSEKIISRVDCPVMILHEEWTKAGINEILIPLDVTKKCKDTVMWALTFSKKLGARINFVSILNTNINIKGSLTDKRSRMIEKWIRSLNVKCSFEIIQALPAQMAQTLIEYAEKGSSDLIMILTHEEFLASNNYLGKFAKEVIHQSPKPVISMSLNNKPMFKTIGNEYKFGRKSFELLNLKTHETTGSLSKNKFEG